MVDFALCMERKLRFWHELLRVHSVSKQLLILISEGLACDELECREVHVYSFTDSAKNSPLSSCGYRDKK